MPAPLTCLVTWGRSDTDPGPLVYDLGQSGWDNCMGRARPTFSSIRTLHDSSETVHTVFTLLSMFAGVSIGWSIYAHHRVR